MLVCTINISGDALGDLTTEKTSPTNQGTFAVFGVNDPQHRRRTSRGTCWANLPKLQTDKLYLYAQNLSAII